MTAAGLWRSTVIRERSTEARWRAGEAVSVPAVDAVVAGRTAEAAAVVVAAGRDAGEAMSSTDVAAHVVVAVVDRIGTGSCTRLLWGIVVCKPARVAAAALADAVELARLASHCASRRAGSRSAGSRSQRCDTRTQSPRASSSSARLLLHVLLQSLISRAFGPTDQSLCATLSQVLMESAILHEAYNW